MRLGRCIRCSCIIELPNGDRWGVCEDCADEGAPPVVGPDDPTSVIEVDPKEGDEP